MKLNEQWLELLDKDKEVYGYVRASLIHAVLFKNKTLLTIYVSADYECSYNTSEPLETVMEKIGALVKEEA